MPDVKRVYDATGRPVDLASESAEERRAREARGEGSKVKTSAAGLGSLRKPGESEAEYQKRMREQQAARIAAQQLVQRNKVPSSLTKK